MTNRLETILREARELPPDELAQLISKASEMLAQRERPEAPPRYRTLLGSGKGLYQTPAEVDQFLRQERDAWER